LSLGQDIPNHDSFNAVHWLPWQEDSFKKAQAEDMPVLLSIHAVWCYWCHVMDDTTYQDSGIIEFINSNFIPIRVDNDHQPDINARYNSGGWPSTVFLTPHGGSIAGVTYLPSDQLLPMLAEVRQAYNEQKSEIYDHCNNQIRERQNEVAKVEATSDITPDLVDRIARRVAGTYDPKFGGFGDNPKFPSAPILKFLCHLFRTTGEPFYSLMLEKTLDNMISDGIMDPFGRGFFRYTAGRDWTHAQHEKMLEDNIGLVQVYTEAYNLLNKESYKNTALATLDYIVEVLFDPEAIGLRGSQGAHSDYFGLASDIREVEEPPAPDPFCYSHLGASGASTLMETGWKLGRSDAISTGIKILTNLDKMALAGNLRHAYDKNGPLITSSDNLLSDWSNLMNALIDSAIYNPSDETAIIRAISIADHIIETFFDNNKGAFYDTIRKSDSIGFLRVREKPLPENITACEGMLKLYNTTGDSKYLEIARRTLSAFIDTNSNYGEHAATYGLCIDILINKSVEITVEGHPEDLNTQELLRAIDQLPEANITLKLILKAQGEPSQAHVCVGNVCIPPISTPADMRSAVETAINESSTESSDPFRTVLDDFTGL